VITLGLSARLLHVAEFTDAVALVRAKLLRRARR
jgi:hypothetical protein